MVAPSRRPAPYVVIPLFGGWFVAHRRTGVAHRCPSEHAADELAGILNWLARITC